MVVVLSICAFGFLDRSSFLAERYGPAPKNSDSAINILLDVVQDQSGKKYKMDHYATRYPTNVLDIASFLVRLIGTHELSDHNPNISSQMHVQQC